MSIVANLGNSVTQSDDLHAVPFSLTYLSIRLINNLPQRLSSTISHNLGPARILTRYEPHWEDPIPLNAPSIEELLLSFPRKVNPPLILFKVACALPSWKIVIQKLTD